MTDQNKCLNFVKQIGKVRNVLWKNRLSVQEKFCQILWQVIGIKFPSLNDKDIGPCMVHKINYESRIKWVICVRWFAASFRSLSTQAGYRLTFSTEGNAVGKVVRWLGDVGRSVELGTTIGITRRDIAKHEIIRFHYCVSQYKRILKAERYVSVRVVSLLTLTNFYQGVSFEVVLKYGNGDISRSSWVSTRSKNGLARLADHYFDNPRHKLMTIVLSQIN